MSDQDWLNGGWQTSSHAKTIDGIGLGIDMDGAYGFQCVDFSRGYSDFKGALFANGNAITIWTNDQPGWTKTDVPQVGAVFVKDYVAPDGVDYGHTGVVLELVPGGFYSIDQNWFNSSLDHGSVPARVYHPANTIKGYLIREEQDMTELEVEQIVSPLLHDRDLRIDGLIAALDTAKAQAATDTQAVSKRVDEMNKLLENAPVFPSPAEVSWTSPAEVTPVGNNLTPVTPPAPATPPRDLKGWLKRIFIGNKKG